MNFEKHHRKSKNKDRIVKIRSGHSPGVGKGCAHRVYVPEHQTWSWQREKEKQWPWKEVVSAQFQRSPSHWFNLKHKCRKEKKIRYINTYIHIYLFYIHTHSCHPAWVLATIFGSKRSFSGNDFFKIQYTTNTYGFSFLSWNSITSHGDGQWINVCKVNHRLNLKWTLPYQGTTVHLAPLPGAVMIFRAGNFSKAPHPS